MTPEVEVTNFLEAQVLTVFIAVTQERWDIEFLLTKPSRVDDVAQIPKRVARGAELVH